MSDDKRPVVGHLTVAVGDVAGRVADGLPADAQFYSPSQKLLQAKEIARRWRRQLSSGGLPQADALMAEMQLVCEALLD